MILDEKAMVWNHVHKVDKTRKWKYTTKQRVKSSSSDYNESNKSNSKSLAYIGSKKSLVVRGVPKNEFFHFFYIFRSTEKFTFSPTAMVS